MYTLRQFFDLNQPIIHFAYGLSFFVMGLAIALQSRSSSRLELARSLAWLAAFGILNSLYEWGEVFSPVQEAYLSPVGIANLHKAHLLFLSASYLCLYQFGAALLRSPERRRWARWIGLGVYAFCAVFIFFFLGPILGDLESWHNTAETLARYIIGFPAGLLAAYALREQTHRDIVPLNAPHIVTMLRAAGLALAFYAVLVALTPPPLLFFPANIVNSSTFEQALGFPPLILLSVVGLVLVVTVIRALEIFQVEIERRIEGMEQQQILAAERERIGRELHDSTIQSAYTVGLLIDSARKLVEPESPVANRLEKAVLALNDVIHDLRRSMVELRSPPSTETLAESLRRMTQDSQFRSLVDLSLELDLSEEERLSHTQTDHILAIVNESLSNIVRHAQARRVQIRAAQNEECLKISIQDDGVGLDSERIEGYGLRNMRERARLLGGSLDVSSKNNKGTLVTVEVPLKE
ncbi:MAG TPA: sensor histidine kinase [Anaerolineaceae bacterium]|nr:sensor histidine kinase [Anaerolineaceae bacterium]